MRYRFVIAAIVFGFLPASHADDRLPIPGQATQAEADQLVKEVFGDDISKAETSEQKLALVKKLLETANQATAPGNRYALLKVSLRVAPDANVATSVIDDMARQFKLNVLSAKAYTIKSMSKTAMTPGERKALAESAIQLTDNYTTQDNFTAAMALIEIALDAATRSRDSELIQIVRAKKDDVSSLQKEYSNVRAAIATLESDPTEAKSNTAVGKYRCLVKGEWENGLPMLALGDDEPLRQLATKELMGPKASHEQVALADGWYELAQDASDGDEVRMLERAALWYQTALRSEPVLSGLAKAKVEKRLELASASNGPEAEDDAPGVEKTAKSPANLILSNAEVIDDFIRISPNGESPNNHVRTKQSYEGPIEITLVARTDSTSIRIYALHAALILNWENNRDQMILTHPGGFSLDQAADGTMRITNNDRGFRASAKIGALQLNQWYKVKWVLTDRGSAVFLNDKLVFKGARQSVLQPTPVMVSGAFNSVVDVKSFSVRPLR